MLLPPHMLQDTVLIERLCDACSKFKASDLTACLCSIQVCSRFGFFKSAHLMSSGCRLVTSGSQGLKFPPSQHAACSGSLGASSVWRAGNCKRCEDPRGLLHAITSMSLLITGRNEVQPNLGSTGSGLLFPGRCNMQHPSRSWMRPSQAAGLWLVEGMGWMSALVSR